MRVRLALVLRSIAQWLDPLNITATVTVLASSTDVRQSETPIDRIKWLVDEA